MTKRDLIKYKNAGLFHGCCVSPSSLLWMIIILFLFIIILIIAGILAIWLLCAYYRKKIRKQTEKELQQNRDEKNQLKLDMFRKKQLDLQMLEAARNARITSKKPLPFHYPESLNSPAFISHVQSPNREKYLLDSSPSLPIIISKYAKELEDLTASTARTPSKEATKKESARKDSRETDEDEFKEEDKEEPKIQQHDTDISAPDKTQPSKAKKKKYEKKQKTETVEKKEIEKSVDQKYPPITPTSKPKRYHHQIHPDRVHEWIKRIAVSTSPIPYFSPNKRILLIPEPSTESLDDENDEENNETPNTTENIESKKIANSLSYPDTMLETDVEPSSTEAKSRNTPMSPTSATPISASVNAPPSSTFLDDQSYWTEEKDQRSYLKSKLNHAENIAEKPKEKIFWKPPDKRAEARLNRTLENPWLNTPDVHSRMSYSRPEHSVDINRYV